MLQNVWQNFEKKKWVRNIQPKNSAVVYLNKYCSDRFRSGRNRLWGPICIQNQVMVFYFSPAPPLVFGQFRAKMLNAARPILPSGPAGLSCIKIIASYSLIYAYI